MPKVINLDDRLIEAMQDGDESALSTIIQRYTAYVGTIVWNIVGNRLNEDDIKEIVSDAFYTLWKNRAKVRKGKLKAYLSSISRSQALDALRRSKQEVSIEEDDIEILVFSRTNRHHIAEAVRAVHVHERGCGKRPQERGSGRPLCDVVLQIAVEFFRVASRALRVPFERVRLSAEVHLIHDALTALAERVQNLNRLAVCGLNGRADF